MLREQDKQMFECKLPKIVTDIKYCYMYTNTVVYSTINIKLIVE